jgi:hypothetical protein
MSDRPARSGTVRLSIKPSRALPVMQLLVELQALPARVITRHRGYLGREPFVSHALTQNR